MIESPICLLSSDQVQQVHDASLEILDNVGLLVRNERARTIFARHGCRVDSQTDIVHLPRAVVERHRASLPPTFTFGARDPDFDRTMPGDAPVIVTGSSAPNLVDPDSGHERRARAEDLARIAHLVNELPAYDVFSISTLAEDAPPGFFTLTRLYPSLKYCRKPVRASGPPEDTRKILDFAFLVGGGEAAYRDHPLTIVPNAGLTSPLTLLGTLTQGNAEFLAAAVLEQMVRPGKETIYASLPTVADMRTGAYAPGAIETGILFIGTAQMARFYNVPCGGYIGLTNAKVNDAQSGYETGMSAIAGLLGGVHMFNMAGLLDALMSFDFAKAVIDDEIAQMLKKAAAGLEFSQDNLALDVIAEVGPAGMYADNLHTVQRMKTTAVLPEIADRDPRQLWLERGGLDSQGRAMRRVHDILTRPNSAGFTPELDDQIRQTFQGLLMAELKPPAGWTRPAESPGRDRGDRAERRRRRSA
ncbi:MAG: trimethylamine:corrinoid methyltransferase [Anaerolineales bacterium]|nr:trimethylamine:corrinoid methyltransferase [Anaerolineales bacterium]